MNRLIRLLIKNSSHLCRGNVSTEEKSKKSKQHHTKNKTNKNTENTAKTTKKGTKTKQKQNKQDTKKPEGNVSARVSPESIVFFFRLFFGGGLSSSKDVFHFFIFIFVVLMSFQINVKNVSRVLVVESFGFWVAFLVLLQTLHDSTRLFMQFLHFA